jgi:hypothetical protein
MKIFEIMGILCIANMAVGFGLPAFVQQRHASRHGRFYRSLLVKPDADDLRLLKIGIPLVFIGVILLIIGNILKP